MDAETTLLEEYVKDFEETILPAVEQLESRWAGKFPNTHTATK